MVFGLCAIDQRPQAFGVVSSEMARDFCQMLVWVRSLFGREAVDSVEVVVSDPDHDQIRKSALAQDDPGLP
jgi:hypothetical protein